MLFNNMMREIRNIGTAYQYLWHWRSEEKNLFRARHYERDVGIKIWFAEYIQTTQYAPIISAVTKPLTVLLHLLNIRLHPVIIKIFNEINIGRQYLP